MAEPVKRIVNVVPNVRVKKEIFSDDEDTIACRICSKTFTTEVAVRNHARMEHTDVFARGDPALYSKPLEPKDLTKAMQERLVKIKTEELLSSMTATDLRSLASEDVSYIIIKSDKPAEGVRKRKSEKVFLEKARKDKEKEVRPITGPFECLQPSSLVADGTCHQIFFSCCEYSAHFRDEHTRRRKRLRCQVCEKPLVGGEDAAPFSCEVCGAGFQSNNNLSEHMATDHIKLKPFECNICHKRFTQQGGVQQHMRMHTGDRPFSCTFCTKSFTQKSGLDQHLRIHTRVKPYRCVICAKTFCQSVHLRQHMRTHTNVAPFQCGVCDKRFKQSSHLNYHLKNHMTEEQKSEYKKMAVMNPRKGVYFSFPAGTERVEVVEVEHDPGDILACGGEEGQEEELEQEEVEQDDQEVIMDEHEQLLAEQSIQIQDGEETYILSDQM